RARAILRLRSLHSRCSLRHWRLLGPSVGTVCLGRRDSHADQGAVATQFSNSTGAGTSPSKMPGLVPLFPSCAGVHPSDLLKSRTASWTWPHLALDTPWLYGGAVWEGIEIIQG